MFQNLPLQEQDPLPFSDGILSWSNFLFDFQLGRDAGRLTDLLYSTDALLNII